MREDGKQFNIYENVKQYYDIITFLENKDKDNQDIIFNEVPSTL